MSQIGRFTSLNTPNETLTGDVGGAVGPTANNINLVGAAGLLVTGNPGTSTLTISGNALAGSFVTDVAGPVSPLLNVIYFINGSNISTDGSVANTIHFNLVNSPSVSGTVTAATGLIATNGNVTVGNTAASAAASDVDFKKSRTGGIITSGDALGLITFQGYDGVGYTVGSQITSTSSGTIAATRVASDLKFYTHPDSVVASTLRMTIAPTGAVTIAAPDSGTGLTVSGGGATVTAGNVSVVAGNVTTVAANTGFITTDGNVTVGNTNANATTSDVDFLKSRTGGVITTGDALGTITFQGHDGTGYTVGSQIKSVSSGTIAATRVASDLEFYTHPDSVVASTQRMTIASTGAVTINAPDSGVGLTIVAGGATVTSGNVALTAGNVNLIAGNVNLPATNTALTHGVITINSNPFVHSLGTASTFLGDYSGVAITSGTDNTGIGNFALNVLSSGSNNTAVGSGALLSATTNSGNTAIGYNSLQLVTGAVIGTNNIALGMSSLASLTGGARNIGIGVSSGLNYTGNETDNIVIGAAGTTGDTHALRIGTSGSGNNQQNACYIAGIAGVTVANAAVTTINTVTGQLGSTSLTPFFQFTWSVITADQVAVINNGYICNAAGLLVLTLPTVAPVGSIIRVTGINTAVGWQIAQNVGQVIHLGIYDSTVGVLGFLQSTNIRDSAELICVVANTEWNVISSVGNLTID